MLVIPLYTCTYILPFIKTAQCDKFPCVPRCFFQVLKIDDYGTFGSQQRRYFIKSKILLHVVNITNKLFIRLYINILQ